MSQEAAMIDELRREVQHLHKQLLLIQTRKERLIFPIPPEFSGLKPFEYEAWKAKVVSKLTFDGDRMGDSTAQAQFVFSRLGPPASIKAVAWLQTTENLTVESLFKFLDEYYLDPARRQEAHRKLHRYNKLTRHTNPI